MQYCRAVLAMGLVAAAVSARAATGDAEITVVAGASLLSASMDQVHPTPTAPPPPFRSSPVQTDHRSLGGGFLLGVRVGYFVASKTLLEAGLAVMPAVSLRTTFSFACPANVTCFNTARSPLESKVGAYAYDAAVLQELTGGAVRPFVTVGVGGISYDSSQADSPTDRGKTSLAFHAGAGVKIDVSRMGVRLEMNDQIIHDQFVSSKTEHDPELRVGVFFRPR